LIVVAAAVAVLALRVLSPLEALQAVSWNVVLLYFRMLVGGCFLFKDARLPHLFTCGPGDRRGGDDPVLFTGLLSIALENVAVVLLVAPVAMSIASAATSIRALFIGMAISSNLQGRPP
jgi:Na+/H+ antiporter NhaD/arsenite permease-like protein